MPFIKVNCKEELEKELKQNSVKRRKREIAKARKLERKY